MEQIRRRDNGILYYGSIPCRTADDAYCRFRDDYHVSLGKQYYKRLNARLREERIHGFKVYFSNEVQQALDKEFGEPTGRINYRLMGLVGISYCRAIDGEEFPDYDEEKFYRWFDWLLSHSSMMRMIGTNAKYGRTAKNRKKRYR